MSKPKPNLNTSPTTNKSSDSNIFVKPTNPINPGNYCPAYTLNSSNVQNLCKEPVILKAMKNTLMIHQIKIQNTRPTSPKINILKAFSQQVAPHLIVLLDIKVYGQNITFYCKNCYLALEKLCITDNLMLKFMVKGMNILLPITLIVGVNNSSITDIPRKMLVTMLESRIIKGDKNSLTNVDLTDFNKISGIGKTLFLDITLPSALNFTLNAIRTLAPKILNLSRNNIETLNGWKRSFYLESIDLSHNKIKSLEDLTPLMNKVLKIIDLSGNPVTDNIPNEELYQKVKELFPTIEKVVNNTQSPVVKIDIPTSERHFVISQEAIALVDQFMEHFFNFYDHPTKRKYLMEMYHSTAIFSLTSNILGNEKNLSRNSQRFKHHAHNILDLKNRTDFAIGPSEIIRKLCYLPKTDHDPVSFSVDVLHYVEDHCCMFTITGVFCESIVNPEVYSFSRTFTLLAGQKGEYFIANDLLNISNCPLRLSATKPFIYKNRDEIELCQVIPPAITAEAKNGFTAVLIELTGLHVDRARSLLEQSDWNIREALKTFVQDLRVCEISQECFIPDRLKEIVICEMPKFLPGMDTKKLGTILKNMENLKDDKYFGDFKCKKAKLLRAEVKRMLENDNN